MERDQFENVLQFVAKYCSVGVDKLKPVTSLFVDLGVDGDDADEFMQAFSRQFGVDISEFNFSQHFGPEAGCNPIVSLFRSVLRHTPQVTPITIEDLVEAAQSKKWKEK